MSTAKFDKSILKEWLRHDTWKAKDALLLMAGIIPSSLDEIDQSLIAAIDYFPEPDAPPIVNGFTLLDGQSVSGLATTGTEDENVAAFYSLWRIFFSNPDHLETSAFEPKYFLDWATRKGYQIDWLEWAKSNELLASGTKSLPKDRLVDVRERNTFLVIIAALCHELDIDPNKRAVAKKIAGLTDDIGCPVSYQTVLAKLKELPEAIDSKSN